MKAKKNIVREDIFISKKEVDEVDEAVFSSIVIRIWSFKGCSWLTATSLGINFDNLLSFPSQEKIVRKKD